MQGAVETKQQPRSAAGHLGVDIATLFVGAVDLGQQFAIFLWLLVVLEQQQADR